MPPHKIASSKNSTTPPNTIAAAVISRPNRLERRSLWLTICCVMKMRSISACRCDVLGERDVVERKLAPALLVQKLKSPRHLAAARMLDRNRQHALGHEPGFGVGRLVRAGLAFEPGDVDSPAGGNRLADQRAFLGHHDFRFLETGSGFQPNPVLVGIVNEDAATLGADRAGHDSGVEIEQLFPPRRIVRGCVEITQTFELQSQRIENGPP